MRFTKIVYRVNGKKYSTVETESNYRIGSITYAQAVLNRLESITAGGGIIIKIEQF